MRWARAAGFLLVMLATLTFPTTATALDDELDSPAITEVDGSSADTAAEAAEPFDGRATEHTVDRVRRTLVGIAVAMTFALIVFWWHTAPARRLRVATQQAADAAMEQD